MEQIEVSIGLSMSGVSFQPSSSTTSPPQAPLSQTVPKVIPQQPGFYSGHAQSTTPTDIMEISSTCVC